MRILVIGDLHGKFPVKLKKKLQKEEFDLILGIGDYGGIDEWRPFIKDMFRRLKNGDERITPEEFFGKERFKNLLKKDLEAAKKVLKELNSLGKPMLSIFGNTDDDLYKMAQIRSHAKAQQPKKSTLRFLKSLKNFKDITYSKRVFKGYNFIGFGGYQEIEAYFKKETFKTESAKKKTALYAKRNKKMKTKFFSLLKKTKKQKQSKIFVLHYPPYGVFDIIRDKKNPLDKESAGVKYFTEAIQKYKPKLVLCGHMHEYQGMKKFKGTYVLNAGEGARGRCAIVDLDDKGKVKAKFVK